MVRLNSCSAYAATRAPAGCGLNTAVLPAARMFTALLTIVGTEWVAGQHHADHAPGRALDDAQARPVAAGAALHRLDAEHVAHRLQLPDLVLQAADAGLLELHPPELLGLLVADPPDHGDHPPAFLESHLRHADLRLRRGSDRLVHGLEDTVARPGRRLRAGAPGARAGAGAADDAGASRCVKSREITSSAISATICFLSSITASRASSLRF